jgi:ribosomal protein S18 acetylase RimI-like enzyme
MPVRRGKPDDLTRLRSIQSRVLAEPWPELLETAATGPPPLFVVEDQAPVGYAIAITDGDDVVYLPELAIHPDRQREGYGSELLAAIAEDYAEFEELRVTVEVTAEDARDFYQTHGFEEREQLENNFESGDGLLLAKEL